MISQLFEIYREIGRKTKHNITPKETSTDTTVAKHQQDIISYSDTYTARENNSLTTVVSQLLFLGILVAVIVYYSVYRQVCINLKYRENNINKKCYINTHIFSKLYKWCIKEIHDKEYLRLSPVLNYDIQQIEKVFGLISSNLPNIKVSEIYSYQLKKVNKKYIIHIELSSSQDKDNIQYQLDEQKKNDECIELKKILNHYLSRHEIEKRIQKATSADEKIKLLKEEIKNATENEPKSSS